MNELIKMAKENFKNGFDKGTTPFFGIKNLYEMNKEEKAELRDFLRNLISDLVDAEVVSDDNGVLLIDTLTKRLNSQIY